MFVMIRTIGTENVKPGEPVVIKYDCQFGRVGAFGIDGKAYGFACDVQPAGCVDSWTLYSRIGDRRVIARAAVIMDGGLLLGFDNALFDNRAEYARVEIAGYGVLAAQ